MINPTKYNPTGKPRYDTHYPYARIGEKPKWLGPRHCTGTAKALARLAWDRKRNS